ncbi:MAG: substrate-binding domain-containing protein [Oscillospiraceae bacterium]|jgi:ABC-type phosphate transport system substrate-binding protein|nr:substrate-binding domain-containing protein [Oscillospiraceae bacterium]
MLKKSIAAALIILMTAGLISCGKTPPTQTPTPDATPTPVTAQPTAPGSLSSLGAPDTSFSFTRESFPVLDGSTAAIPLGVGLSGFFLGYSQDEALEKYPFAGTAASVENLYSGFSDFLLVYDPPESTKDLRGGIEYLPIGRDGLVFLTHKDNPVKSLTDEQLRGIYEGRITNWSEVGGDDAEIVAYQRNETSGSQAMFLRSFPDIALTEPPKELVSGSMSGLLEAVAIYNNEKYAIGYSVYYYAAEMKKDENIKLLQVDGTAADSGTIASRAYPYTAEFYAAYMKKTDNQAVLALAKWFKTEQATRLLELCGYVPANR